MTDQTSRLTIPQPIEEGFKEMTRRHLAEGMSLADAAFLEGYQRGCYVTLKQIELTKEGRASTD